MTDEGPATVTSYDLSRRRLAVLAILPAVLIIYYYWPCLSRQADFYVSDIGYYFEPFAAFVHNQTASGVFPLWNPDLYCGMSQLAMPNPGLLYLPGWLIFLLPFSAGISAYMILHQILFGTGSYLYMRALKGSRAASLYAAVVLSLCAYCFSLVRNLTLPASVAWLPLGLYFERRIRSGSGEHPFPNMVGLAVTVAMIVHVGRPEVGAPELLILFLACLSGAAVALIRRGSQKFPLPETLYKLASVGLGVALGLPSILPGLEWTSLSPRSGGLEMRWVFTWSANWYDYLSMVLSQPLGDLCRLDERSAVFRQLVLSRGGYIPFLTSAYLSPVACTLAVWGLTDWKNRKQVLLVIILLIGFVLMSLGNYTAIGPAIVGLSHAFAAFRYPVKLIIFPSLLIVLLSARGLDLLLSRNLSSRVFAGTAWLWFAVLVSGVVLAFCPQIGLAASKWHFLFRSPVAPSTLEAAQHLMASSMIYSAGISIAAYLAAYLYLKNQVKAHNCASFLIILSAATLIHSAITYRIITPAGFYEHPCIVAERLQALFRQDRSAQDCPRFFNLYFDPLSTPDDYEYLSVQQKLSPAKRRPKLPHTIRYDEDFYQYARELVLYNTSLDFGLPSSYGYEASETAEYKTWFSNSLSSCSQSRARESETNAIISDLPIHRFARLTASRFVNTQVYQTGKGDLPQLDGKCFQLVEENRKMNYRIYQTINPRPRLYFSKNLHYIDSFNDFLRMMTAKDDLSGSQAFDSSADLTCILKSDLRKYSDQFKQVTASEPQVRSPEPEHGASNLPENCELIKDNGQEMRLRLNCHSSKLLVIADHFYPGWKAELDGRPVEVLKANIVNRAVLIPSGAHVLRIYYFCKPLFAGVVAASISLLIFLLGGLLIFKGGKEPPQD